MLKAFLVWLWNKLTGKSGTKEAYDQGTQYGTTKEKLAAQEAATNDAKRQAQGFADRPTNDDEFAARLRNAAKASPRYPDRSSNT